MPEQPFSRSLQGKFASLLLFAAVSAFAQEKAVPPAQQPTTVLHTSTQLVIVDVTVQDSNGKPIHGLTRDNFQLVEGKTPQTTRNFEEHSNSSPSAPGIKMPPMPPGTFTDYVAVKPNSTLNVILLDTINTPMSDQSYVRDQLKKYVKQAPANAQIAIIAMGSKLTILQGFTSDPEVLKEAVEHKLIPRGSNLLDDSVGTNVDQEKLSEVAADSPGTS
ncbi:MAG TPA: VWA domain-containing protein, partial [Acidobacteriaceae bacterium]